MDPISESCGSSNLHHPLGGTEPSIWQCWTAGPQPALLWLGQHLSTMGSTKIIRCSEVLSLQWDREKLRFALHGHSSSSKASPFFIWCRNCFNTRGSVCLFQSCAQWKKALRSKSEESWWEQASRGLSPTPKGRGRAARLRSTCSSLPQLVSAERCGSTLLREYFKRILQMREYWSRHKGFFRGYWSCLTDCQDSARPATLDCDTRMF